MQFESKNIVMIGNYNCICRMVQLAKRKTGLCALVPLTRQGNRRPYLAFWVIWSSAVDDILFALSSKICCSKCLKGEWKYFCEHSVDVQTKLISKLIDYNLHIFIRIFIFVYFYKIKDCSDLIYPI